MLLSEIVKNKLFEYALWYTSRYAVSENRLKFRLKLRLGALIKKAQENIRNTSLETPIIEDGNWEPVEAIFCDNSIVDEAGIIAEVFQEIQPYYDEISCARSLLQIAVQVKKPPIKILASLREKQYTKTTISLMQEEFSDYFEDFESLFPKIESRVRDLMNRGYGENYISPYIAREFWCTKDQIKALISSKDYTDSLQKYMEKKGQNKSTRALYEHLYQRGYSSDLIKSIVQENSD